MTIQQIENIFANYGNIVWGDRFLGRESDLRVIDSRVIRPREGGNLAVIGDTRIGKSSLVWEAVIEHKDDLLDRRMIPVWINLGIYDQSADFFRSLVTECMDNIEDQDWDTDSINRAAARAVQPDITWVETYGRIQRFFKKVRDSGTRVLFILDEFDHARYLFRNDTSSFQGLRELSYRPEWRVNYITTSRRTIFEIERQTNAISTFDGIFKKHFIGMLEDSALNQFFDRINGIGINLTTSLRDKFDYFCGGHPYLLDMMGYELLEHFRDDHAVNMEKAVDHFSPSCLSHYDRMIELLREDGRLGKLMQILFGPVVDVNQTDVDEFLQYGFIKPNRRDSYDAFSAHFQAFLGVLQREAEPELWPIWAETERALRRSINLLMTDNYGEEWVSILEKSKPNLKKDVFESCRRAQKKEQRLFGERASSNLIDYTYPHDLFSIIFAEWTNTFKSIFGKDKSYWGQRAALLAKIRNPLAHNRGGAIEEYERQIAEGYCREILAVIRPEATCN